MASDEKIAVRFIGGFAVVAALVIFVIYYLWDPDMGPIKYVVYLMAALVFIAGIYFLLVPVKENSMKQYFLDEKGRCKNTGNKCEDGDCRGCVFARQ